MRTIAIVLTFGLLASCASSHDIEPQLAPASVNFGQATSQRVELSNFDFTPREIHLKAGQPYALVLTNLASGGHNFAAPEFFAAARILPDEAAQVGGGEIEVPAMSSRTIHLVPGAGTFKVVCTHTGHALLGMTGTIRVD